MGRKVSPDRLGRMRSAVLRNRWRGRWGRVLGRHQQEEFEMCEVTPRRALGWSLWEKNDVWKGLRDTVDEGRVLICWHFVGC